MPALKTEVRTERRPVGFCVFVATEQSERLVFDLSSSPDPERLA